MSWSSIDTGNDLVHDGTKLLPEPTLTEIAAISLPHEWTTG